MTRKSLKVKTANDKQTIAKSLFKKLVVVGVFVSLATQAYLMNSLASFGREINSLNREKEGLEQEINSLGNGISSYSSLESIRQRAVENLSMKSGEIEYLNPPPIARH